MPGYGIIELLLGSPTPPAASPTLPISAAHLGGLFGGWLDVQDFHGRGLFGKQTLRTYVTSFFPHKREPVKRSMLCWASFLSRIVH